MVKRILRRAFTGSLLGAGSCMMTGVGALGTLAAATEDEANSTLDQQTNSSSYAPGSETQQILKTLKWGMIQVPGTVLDRFQAARKAGFDGVELDSPGGPSNDEVRSAVEKTGLVVDGTVDSTHWRIRLTDPDPNTRHQGLADLKQALRDTHAWGGHSVLLVPGHGDDGTPTETWERSTEQIRRAIPTAARLGIHILIENVWNHMFYDHHGPDDQSADELARFVDLFESPWIGVQFDIGNHQKYGKPASWIRTLGKRIVKLDVKDWSSRDGFCKIGDGDVDWSDVRSALQEICFSGWAAAEVTGGGPERLRDICKRMDQVLALKPGRQRDG